MVSQPPPAQDRPRIGGRAAIPSWLVSVVVHAALLTLLATVGISVAKPPPEDQFVVGIMIKTQSAQGPVMQSQDTTFQPRPDSDPQSIPFVADSQPAAVADSLPTLPTLDLAAIGVAGSELVGSSDLWVGADQAPVAGMVSTEFFGARVWGNKFVYVVDRSGSMLQRDRIGAAKRELHASFSALPPDTQFQIIFYNDRPDLVLKSAPAKLHFATDHNKLRATRTVHQAIPEGGTDHIPALQMALAMQPDVVFFLTDADDFHPQHVATVTALNQQRAKIHAIEFGIGAAVNEQNELRELASRNGGTDRYVDAAVFGRLGRNDP